MATKRERILEHIASTVSATTGVRGTYRSRPEALRREECPAILVEPVQESQTYSVIDFIECELAVKCSVYVRGVTAGESFDTAADPIVSDMYARLMADRTLGGRVFDIVPSGTYFSVVEGDGTLGVVDQQFTIRYRTRASDLT